MMSYSKGSGGQSFMTNRALSSKKVQLHDHEGKGLRNQYDIISELPQSSVSQLVCHEDF